MLYSEYETRTDSALIARDRIKAAPSRRLAVAANTESGRLRIHDLLDHRKQVSLRLAKTSSDRLKW